MANPLIPQGFPNRVRGAVSITDVPALNVIISYLGKDGISMRPDGPATDILPTIIGIVSSQVSYQQVISIVHMLRTQGSTVSYQQRFTTDTMLGEVVVISDATTFGNFTLLNYYLVNLSEVPFSGTDAGYVVAISGYLITNDDIWI